MLDGTSGLSQLLGNNVEMRPVYQFGILDGLFSKSNVLRQCVDAMVTNIAGFGYRVVPYDEDVDIDPRERATLMSWIKHANTDRSLVQENRAQIYEFEKYGLRYLEVIRNITGRPTLLRHVPVSTVRILSRQKTPVRVTKTVLRGGSRVSVAELKRFRKYVQRIGATVVYFKEYGDPRTMDYRTGEYQSKAGGKIPDKYRATELMHHKQDSEDVYGIPRWCSMFKIILGSAEAEECNLRYFEDNMVPAAIITISGGRLTADSFNEIRRVAEEGGLGKQNQLMLLEAIPETGGIEDHGVAHISIERLADSRPSDGLFSVYDVANQNKVRSCFRLPPVLLGQSQDVSFATANVSTFVAEMQVFQPQRMAHDDWLNNSFVNSELGLGLRTVKLESKGPPLTNPGEVVNALTAANAMGALTPRSAISIINEQMQVSIPLYPEKGQDGWMDWMDLPIQIGVRKTAIDAGGRLDQPSEPREESAVRTPDIDLVEDGKGVGDVGARRNLTKGRPRRRRSLNG
jgi:PBSX family phage portal protein